MRSSRRGWRPAAIAERFNRRKRSGNRLASWRFCPRWSMRSTFRSVATGGIADARGVAAALLLGASAVQIGTGFLRAPEAMTLPVYADRLSRTEAHETVVTRAFSGRPGRSVATAYVRAAMNGPTPAPYPVQRGLTAAMRDTAKKAADAERMQMWAGQSAKFARAEPAGEIVRQLWDSSLQLLKRSCQN